MELLGTTGNTPGPTAAKAQLVYDAMQKEAAALANAKKRRRVNYHDASFFSNNKVNGQVDKDAARSIWQVKQL
jgi:hypothetical protein